MKIDPGAALTLAAVIRKDLEAVAKIETHASGLPRSPRDRAQLDSLGFALHNIYNALENSFTQISLSFENHVRDSSRWHRELLEKMFFDLGALRPAVLTPAARSLLSDLLGFRHLFRHAYEFTLDDAKTDALWNRWQQSGVEIKQSLTAFADQLALIGEKGI